MEKGLCYFCVPNVNLLFARNELEKRNRIIFLPCLDCKKLRCNPQQMLLRNTLTGTAYWILSLSSLDADYHFYTTVHILYIQRKICKVKKM
jgi:hypothetical protein